MFFLHRSQRFAYQMPNLTLPNFPSLQITYESRVCRTAILLEADTISSTTVEIAYVQRMIVGLLIPSRTPFITLCETAQSLGELLAHTAAACKRQNGR